MSAVILGARDRLSGPRGHEGAVLPVWAVVLLVIVAVLIAVAVYDLLQTRHSITRNFPVVGHLRFMLEAVGPELRQYIVTGNDEERPFSRNQRRWVYASSKRQNNYFGFGSDNDLERTPGYLIIKNAAFPHPTPPGGDPPDHPVPCAKILGAGRDRRLAFRPPSIVNISGMSFGSLSGRAIEALNGGARIAGCLHNTGEGGISAYHKQGGDLIFQIGTAYFGCRDADGHFSMDRLVAVCDENPVRAIEIKLSQGAKPGVGGLLPGAKVTSEIAAARGIPEGIDCQSPSAHTEFRDVDSMLDFVESIADATGLPVGIKAAIGDQGFWDELAEQMVRTGRGVDYIAVDGGEGGTGAAPLVFADHVALPYFQAQSRVYRAFALRGLHHQVVFVGAGKLGLPESGLLAFALGADMVHVAREAMLSIGCIQAQRCHTGHCPAGIATQSAWLQRGLDPTLKSVRCANYVAVLRRELLHLARTCGRAHPALVTTEHFEFLTSGHAESATERYDVLPGWSLPSREDCDAITEIMNRGTGAAAAVAG